MDIICLRKFDMPGEQIFCSSHEYEYGDLVNNCVFKAHKNSPFLQYCLNQIDSIDLNTMSFGKAGPFLFQKVVKELELENMVSPYRYFNPIAWKNVGELILGERTFTNRIKEYVRPALKPGTMPGRKISSDSYAVHLWNEVWRSSNFDKNGTYSSNSLFEKLKKKHRIK